MDNRPSEGTRVPLTGHLTYENTVRANRRVLIFVDGVETNDVVECHTEEGWALVYQRDSNNRFVLDESRESIETTTVRGKVTIKEIGWDD